MESSAESVEVKALRASLPAEHQAQRTSFNTVGDGLARNQENAQYVRCCLLDHEGLSAALAMTVGHPQPVQAVDAR